MSQSDPCGRSGSCRPINTLSPLTDVYEVTGDGGGGGHGGADEMGAPAASLAALEVAVTGGGATLALGKLVAIHGDAHTASRFAPLEAGVAEDVGQSFLFGYATHLGGAGYYQCSHSWRDVFTLDVVRGEAQVFKARIGAGADKDSVYSDIGDLLL